MKGLPLQGNTTWAYEGSMAGHAAKQAVKAASCGCCLQELDCRRKKLHGQPDLLRLQGSPNFAHYQRITAAV